LEGAIGAEAGVEAGIGVLGAASTALGVLAPLGLLGFGLYEAISGEKQAEEQAKKQDQAAAMEQSEIQVEDQQSQFTQGRPSFGSMSLAPNLDMTQ
jgi:cytochrome c-type biogenesis protein CcmH/NrfG